MESVGRDGIGAVVGYTVPVGRLRWLMREFAEAGVDVAGYRVSGSMATVSVDSVDKELADVVAGDVAGHERGKGKRKRGGLGASVENATGAALVGATWVLAGALLFAFQSLFALAAVAPMLIVSVIWRSIRMRKRQSIETVYAQAPDLAWKDAALWAGAALVALFFAVAVSIVGLGGGL